MSLEQKLRAIKASRDPAGVVEPEVIDVETPYTAPSKPVESVQSPLSGIIPAMKSTPQLQVPSSTSTDSLNLKSEYVAPTEEKEEVKDTSGRDLSSWLVGATPLLVGLLTGNTLEGVDTAANYYVKEGAEKKPDKNSLQLKIEEMKLKREQEKLKRDMAKTESEKSTGLKDSDVMTIEDEFGNPIVTTVSDAVGKREYRRNPVQDFWQTRGALEQEKMDKAKQTELRKIENLEFKNREDIINKREQHPVTKDTYSISKSYNDIVSASKGENAASDLGMIFAYMKMLDPSSVVRESEQLTARQARSPEEALMNVEAWFKEGRTLTKSQIARFVAESKKIRDSQFKLQSEVDSSFKKRAGTRGLDITPYLTIPTEPEIQKETTGKKDELVRVISPSGVSGTIPKSQLKDALSEGYKVSP